MTVVMRCFGNELPDLYIFEERSNRLPVVPSQQLAKFLIDRSKKKRKRKMRKGMPSTGGDVRHVWLTGPDHHPSLGAVIVHLFDNYCILSYMRANEYTHTPAHATHASTQRQIE